MKAKKTTTKAVKAKAQKSKPAAKAKAPKQAKKPIQKKAQPKAPEKKPKNSDIVKPKLFMQFALSERKAGEAFCNILKMTCCKPCDFIVFATLYALSESKNGKQLISATHGDLGKLTGLHRDTIGESTKYLEKRGVLKITVSPGRNEPNVYEIIKFWENN